MRILIADDQMRRYSRLIGELESHGVPRTDVQFVPCANDARTCLEREYFDLLILDILLPLWPDTEPDVRYSLDLLTELHEGKEFRKPGRILGITADLQVAGQAARRFEAQTWTVIEYSESSDEWISRAVNCAQYILSEGKSSGTARATHEVDLAVVCALAKPELEEVLKLDWNWSPSRPLDDITFVHDGHLDVGGRRISVCATSAPRMGMVSTALRSAAIISLLRPRLIAMCGICAGVKGKVNVGDVLLVDPAWDFQSGKRVRDEQNTRFSMSPHQLYSPEVVRTHVEQIRRDQRSLDEISTKYGSDAPGTTRVVIGPVASGSAVLADGLVIQDIKLQHRELIGIEMEAYGMYAAASAASRPQPLSFALKAVCDFADPDKEDKNQRYAAYASANVLRLLMERFGPRLLD